MGTDLITEKLSFQVKSFQESFELLSNSVSLMEMAKQFDKILRGSFFTTNISIFHKADNGEVWTSLISKDIECHKKLIENVDDGSFKINSNSDSTQLYTTTNLIDSSFLAIILGGKFDKTPYSKMEKVTFQIYIQIFDSAYQALLSHKTEKKLIFSLNNRVSQMFSLIDTGIEISKVNLGDQLLELALSRAIALTNSGYGRIKITNEDGNINQILFPPNIKFETPVDEHIIIQKFQDDGSDYEFSLCEKESREGLVKFEETDELLLGAIARQVQAAIENDRFHKEALEIETIKKELSVASSIQKKIIPEKMPLIEGYNLAGINIPSKEVGGDYYDCFQLSDGRFALIMADVAGKGVPASLLVSTLNASLKAYLDMNLELSELAIKINKIIYNASPPDKFITFFIAILEPESGELDIINAGHNPSLILKNDGSLVKIEAGGIAFGMFDMGFPFEGEKLKLEPGERILLFTDGIPEAMTIDEEEYSDERLEEFFSSKAYDNSQKFIDELMEDVRTFTGGAPQSDDITALYLVKQK